MRILIIEDDLLMQLGLEKTLNSYTKFEVIGQAEDGYSGVNMALNLKPDLIIMDLELQRLDGISAIKQIREKLPETRIVILTSHTLETEVIASLASGADAYCIKGASLERLLAAIDAAINGAAYLDPQIARLVIDNLKLPSTSRPNSNISLLSQRETEVLKLIVEGKSNNEIAEKLYLSPNTIKTHVRGIMNKLAVDDRVQIAVVALRSGIV
ncbi:response regulator transcription factor [Chroococcus sp. FPU101]|uniref:response regulator n=1 Tax=Chroococcus sp. FPU101 TaxID=1974212 RepID=UPI001A8E0ED2|nr:response regulator transcription factor [Chroococcus sp. FPU101]GFE69059.1 two component transcriptional regulator, LuxR family [Chroococcus sp. FPU101]